MDFGCGAGRTLKHFLQTRSGRVLGGGHRRDQHRPAARDGLATVACDASDYMPPLELESASFDLIWSVSVFTHLTDNSLPWLLELHRLLKPDGLLIATYMGRWTSELLAGEPWDEDGSG